LRENTRVRDTIRAIFRAGCTKLKKRLGEWLVERNKLNPPDLERALRLQQDESGEHERLGALLLKLGVISGRDLAEALAAQLELPLVEPADYPEIPLLEERVSVRFLKESKALPLHEDAQGLVLALVDPLDQYIIGAFRLLTHRPVSVRVAAPLDMESAFERLYGSGKTSMGEIVGDIETRDEEGFNDDVQQLKDLAEEAPTIRLVNLIITHALEARASDIHIEPFENRLIVRYRVDGVMHEVESPPRRLSAAVISRIKIMANLDIAERRLPQDGRIKLRIQGKELDLRVSTVPTMYGESVVMRILDKSGAILSFAALGFDDEVLSIFLEALSQPHGIILVTGPTGSGKTTTLYTALQTLNKPDVKILTVEDPVEYQMEGVNQIQVKPQIGLTFANALRSIVRQDPDVIMIGEIRDLETAQIAVQSALTGHLVLSTLHTNDAASTINRLLDMGMDDYLLTSTVIGILAQRLVRTLCGECRQLRPVLPELAEEMGLHRYTAARPIELYHAVGCPHCGNTGYVGRVGIVEMLPINDGIRSLVMQHATAGEIHKLAVQQGMRTMFEHGLRKVMAGVTTIEEVLRVTREA
jgi:general secretion pathway protein E